MPFSERGRYFLFHSKSLAVVEIPIDAHELIVRSKGIGEDKESKEFVDCHGTVAHLRIRKQLAALLSRIAAPDGQATAWAKRSAAHGISEVYLSLTSVCNLACSYCFGRKGTGDRTVPKRMSRETARQSLRYIFSQVPSDRPLSIVFWGGEPLLNPEVLEVALNEIEQERITVKRDISLATTTNGTLLTPEMSELLARHKVVVNLSLDGNEEVHDRSRRFPDGRGSFSTIEKNLSSHLLISAKYFRECVPRARLTITRQSVRDLFDNYRTLWERGIPVVWCKEVSWLDPGSEYLLRDEDFQILRGQFDQIRDYLIGRVLHNGGTEVYPQVWWDLHALHQRRVTQSWCGAGTTNISIETDGSISACYHLAGNPRFACGSIWSGFVPQTQYNPPDRLVDGLSHCRDCGIRYLCGGGCVAKGVELLGDPYAVSASECLFSQIFQEYRIRMYLALMTSSRSEQIRRILSVKPTTRANDD